MKKPTYRFQKRIAQTHIGEIVTGKPPHGEWDFRGLQQGLLSSDHVVTAWDSGTLLGFASASAEDEVVDLTWLFVRNSHQRKGIGAELVNRFLAKFPRCTAVNVIANQAAEAFYRSCGFVPAPNVMPMIKLLNPEDHEAEN